MLVYRQKGLNTKVKPDISAYLKTKIESLNLHEEAMRFLYDDLKKQIDIKI